MGGQDHDLYHSLNQFLFQYFNTKPKIEIKDLKIKKKIKKTDNQI